MKVAFVANIFYSVQIDFADGRSITKFFTHQNPLKSRSAALTYYLMEACLSNAYAPDQLYATVNVHDLRTSDRFELTSSVAWQTGEQTFAGLEVECNLFREERIKFNGYAVYNPDRAQLVTLVNRNYQNIEQLRTGDTVIIIADDYAVFFKRKKQQYLTA